MIIAASFVEQVIHVLYSIAMAFANVAFTGSLILSFAMTWSILWYAKRRPQGAPLSWGQAMAAAMYVTFILFFFFGVVPDRWLNYAEGSLGMRSDAILAGPGSTGWFENIPVVISKQAVADIVTILIYGLGFNLAVIMWAVWQKRGATTEQVEPTSTYGRPLVKA
jgi:hypothetical protein